jgi:Xaa-Pro dipeptidase
MPVGGVRIEDDILITSKGYENLTTAPKGDAMFDIIRGQSSSFRTAKRPAALPPTDPELPRYRAPGCPLRTTPPGMQPIKRAATIPNQTAWEQLDGTDYYNYSLGFRRSMTTDERVQHWRQSCHRSSASKHPSPHQLESVTVCGSDTNAVKHLYIGQNCTSPFQANDSPQCTNCVILSQTLVRLRQNLDASTQKSAQQPYQPQDPHPLTNSKHSFPTPPAVDAGSYATQCVLATAAERKGIDAGEKPQSHRIGQMPEAKEIPTPPKQQRHVPTASDAPRIQDRTLTTISGKTNLKDAVTVPKEVFDHPLVQSLTNYYQAAARSDAYSSSQEPPSMASTRQQISAYAETARVPDHVLYQALRSEAAMPIRTCRSQPQERRRPSNHTDDRDWMA